jgi:RNA polymerase sigma-70 factor, ECF subfamily
VAVSRAGIRLALVAALQYLSARQRALLILRDVLEWPAAQVAELLGTTTTAVNSGLRRARAQLARVLPAEDELAEPAEPDRRALLERSPRPSRTATPARWPSCWPRMWRWRCRRC